MFTTAANLVGKKCDLCHLPCLGIGKKEPPVKAIVIVEVNQVELVSLCCGLCVGEQILATFREAQEDMPCCQSGHWHCVPDEECKSAWES